MSGPFPIGATLDGGSFEITERLYGSADRGLFRARAIHDPSPGTLLVALGGRQRRSAGELADELALPVMGVARLRHIGPLEHERDGEWHALVEQEPAGTPLDAFRPLGPRQIASVGVDLCRVLQPVHATGRGLGGLRPELIYVRERGEELVVTQVAPRAERFLVSSTPPSYGAGPMFDELYLAPEQLALRPPSPAGDVFALAALLTHLSDGRHPFPADDVGRQALAIVRGERRPLRGRFARIFEAALALEASERPSLAQLERALRDGLPS